MKKQKILLCTHCISCLHIATVRPKTGTKLQCNNKWFGQQYWQNGRKPAK